MIHYRCDGPDCDREAARSLPAYWFTLTGTDADDVRHFCGFDCVGAAHREAISTHLRSLASAETQGAG